jgi:hypothetical protein
MVYAACIDSRISAFEPLPRLPQRPIETACGSAFDAEVLCCRPRCHPLRAYPLMCDGCTLWLLYADSLYNTSVQLHCSCLLVMHGAGGHDVWRAWVVGTACRAYSLLAGIGAVSAGDRPVIAARTDMNSVLRRSFGNPCRPTRSTLGAQIGELQLQDRNTS